MLDPPTLSAQVSYFFAIRTVAITIPPVTSILASEERRELGRRADEFSRP